MNRGSVVLTVLLISGLAVAVLAYGARILPSRLMAAREMAALMAVKTIQTAEVGYHAQFNRCGSLAELGRPADMIPADLASGKKTGYIFTVTCRQDGYSVTAVPESFNRTGPGPFTPINR